MNNLLYSLILEFAAKRAAVLPLSTGYQTYSLFLKIIAQIDPALSKRIHDGENYRPFTVSSLLGGAKGDKDLFLQEGQTCGIRVTLLDGGPLWRALSTCFLENRLPTLHLDTAELMLKRVISTPDLDPTGWAGHTDWQTLATTPAKGEITLNFASPTAFSLGNRRFGLFPDPLLVWQSLTQKWNLSAPEALHIDKNTLSSFITDHVMVSEYDLHTTILYLHAHLQKGFIGTCIYQLKAQDSYAPQIAALAEFARYAGVGSKTTQGMGQVQAWGSHRPNLGPHVY